MVSHEASVTMKEPSQSSARSPGFQRGVLFITFSSGVNIVFLFLETMVAVRLLEPESYGLYLLLIAIVNFLVIVADFGLKTALTQLIAGSGRDRQAALANTTLVFRLAVILVISALVLLGRRLLLLVDPSLAISQYVLLIPLMLLVSSLDEMLLAILQGFQAYQHIAIAQIARSALRLFVSVFLLVVLDMGIVALIYSWIVSFAVSSLYAFLVLPLSRRFAWHRPLLRETLRFGAPLQMDRFLWFASTRIDTFLLVVLAGPTAVAYYNVAARIPAALMVLAQSYIAVYFPTMAALLATGRGTEAGRMLGRSLRLISFVLAFLALVSVLFGQDIITLFFSEKYAASSAAFSVLMVALHMSFLVSLMGYTLTSAGFPGRSLRQNLMQTTLIVLLDLVLIPLVGFIGPAFGRLFSSYTVNPVSVTLLRRSGIPVTARVYIKQTALLWLCAGLYWWLEPAALTHRLATILIFIVLNVALSTVSRDDLGLVLPKAMTKRLGIRKEPLSDGC